MNATIDRPIPHSNTVLMPYTLANCPHTGTDAATDAKNNNDPAAVLDPMRYSTKIAKDPIFIKTKGIIVAMYTPI